MFSPVSWLYRHVRQVRLAFALCLIVTYSTLLLGGIPIIAYFDKLQANDALADAVSTTDQLDRPYLLGDAASARLSAQGSNSNSSSVKLIYRSSTENGTRRAKIIDTLNAVLQSNQSQTATGLSNYSLTGGTREGTVPTQNPWNVSTVPPMFSAWRQNRMNACDGGMELYGRQFARLNNVIVDRTFCVAKAQTGADVEKVLYQDENAEYYKQMRHCFQLQCNDARSLVGYHFAGFNFLDDWLVNLKTFDVRPEGAVVDANFNIAFLRREYANLYHTINDWYNIFLLMVFFEKGPSETNVVLVDAHPKGKLDSAWSVLFNSTRMLSELAPRTMFTTLVWGMQGYNSALKEPFRLNEAPVLLLEEFRQFFLDRFQLKSTKQLDCSAVSVLFIWRRNYLAHPRNPTGLVQRKIDNEEELLNGLRSRHPNYSFKGVQIDAYDMKDQLRLVSEADVLIGMHGAGLSHTLFVPPHGAMIELVPRYYGSDNPHFVDLAIRRGLALSRWVNAEQANEKKDFRTYVPVEKMDDLLQQVVKTMCTESQQVRLERTRQMQQRENAQLKGLKLANTFVRRRDAKPLGRRDPPLQAPLVQAKAMAKDRFDGHRLHVPLPEIRHL